MAVVAAGVHPALGLRGVGQAGRLVDRQGVHVGAHGDHPARPGPAALDHPDDAGFANAFNNFIEAKFTELFRHDPRRAVDVVPQFRVGVEVAAPFGDPVV